MFRKSLLAAATLIERVVRKIGELTSWLALGILVSVLIAVVAGGMGANEMLNWVKNSRESLI